MPRGHMPPGATSSLLGPEAPPATRAACTALRREVASARASASIGASSAEGSRPSPSRSRRASGHGAARAKLAIHLERLGPLRPHGPGAVNTLRTRGCSHRRLADGASRRFIFRFAKRSQGPIVHLLRRKVGIIRIRGRQRSPRATRALCRRQRARRRGEAAPCCRRASG